MSVFTDDPKSVHYSPNPDADIEGPHGIDVVVSDQTDQPTVYFSMLGSGGVVRLIPGATDQWKEYDTKLTTPGLPPFVPPAGPL